LPKKSASRVDAADLPLEPQLAVLTSEVPTRGDWLYEVKVDGYRILTRVERGKPQIFTRRGYDWTDRMPALAGELATLGIGSAWLDGEIVVPNDSGGTDFNALQNAFDRRSTTRIAYYLFDAPFLAGRDLRGLGNRVRRELLEEVLGDGREHIRFSTAFEGSAADPRTGLRAWPRRSDRQARRCTLRLGPVERVAQVEVQATAGVRGLRVHGASRGSQPGRKPAARCLPRAALRQRLPLRRVRIRCRGLECSSLGVEEEPLTSL
jgi:hypothetical protein